MASAATASTCFLTATFVAVASRLQLHIRVRVEILKKKEKKGQDRSWRKKSTPQNTTYLPQVHLESVQVEILKKNKKKKGLVPFQKEKKNKKY